MTVLSGQNGNKFLQSNSGEILTCYTQEELIKIANSILQGKKAIELNAIINQQLIIKDSIIQANSNELFAKNNIINDKESKLILKENIITGKNLDIDNLNLTIKKLNRKLNWTNLKWGTTTVVITGGLIYFMIN